jgi:hypothetical protein
MRGLCQGLLRCGSLSPRINQYRLCKSPGDWPLSPVRPFSFRKRQKEDCVVVYISGRELFRKCVSFACGKPRSIRPVAFFLLGMGGGEQRQGQKTCADTKKRVTPCGMTLNSEFTLLRDQTIKRGNA